MGNPVSKGAPPASHGIVPKTSVSFSLNGRPVVVTGAAPALTLNEWIRDQPDLKGTKKMCGEGGCGCCVVAVTRLDPATQEETTIAINSVSLTSSPGPPEHWGEPGIFSHLSA